MPITRKDFERYRLHIRFAKERHEKKREQTILTWAGLEVLLDRLDALEKVREAAQKVSADWEPMNYYHDDLVEALSQCPPLEDGEESKP